MERRKPITEEDVRQTELVIARSFENLKQSAVQASRRSLRSAGGFAEAAPLCSSQVQQSVPASSCTGFSGSLPGVDRKKRARRFDREYSFRSGATMALLTMMMPLVKTVYHNIS